MSQNQIELCGERDKPTIIVGDIITLPSVIDRPGRQKIHKDTVDTTKL